MAIVSLQDVQVTRVFWQGKGAEVAEEFTTREGPRQVKYALFFDEPHGLNEGAIINASGVLSVTVEDFTWPDGSAGRKVNFKLNKPRVSDVRGGQIDRVGEPALTTQWPDVQPIDNGAPF